MANVNSPFGFRPIRAVTGYGHVTEEQPFSSALSSTIYAGDLVKSDGSGGLALAAPGDAILGIFLGWYIPDRSSGAANYNGPISASIPHSRVWTPGTVIPSGISPRALIHWDPNETLEAQCCGSIATTDIGALVNAIPMDGNSAFGRSGWAVGPVSPEGGPITAIAVSNGGSSYESVPTITVVRHASDPYAGAAEAEVTATLDSAAIDAFVITSGGFYSASHAPTIVIDHASGGGASAAAGTVTITNTTRSQFRVERILEKPVRVADSNNNTTGYSLLTSGQYARVELRIAKHERGGSAMAVAV